MRVNIYIYIYTYYIMRVNRVNMDTILDIYCFDRRYAYVTIIIA